uniref:SGNH hydrolase-type esterase domain-containing protein n=1 Tax=Heterosigma akashiwo TaxID=2829 RepID=A0A7S3Y540_HETAK
MVVVGDSYSDGGGDTGYVGLYANSTNVVPSIPSNQYSQNRFSNGKTYVQIAADTLGLMMNNQAVGYAQVLHNPLQMDANTCRSVRIPDMMQQFWNWRNSSDLDLATVNSSLVVVAIGGNDLAELAQSYSYGAIGLVKFMVRCFEIVKEMVKKVGEMVTEGGLPKAHVVLVTFPAAWLLPYFRELGKFDDGALESFMKYLIRYQMKAFQEGGYNFWNLADEMEEVWLEGSTNGIISNWPCFSFSEDSPLMADCPNYSGDELNRLFGQNCTADTVDDFMFFDTIHPTAATHKELGTSFAQYLVGHNITSGG